MPDRTETCTHDWKYSWDETSYIDDNEQSHPYIRGTIRECTRCSIKEETSMFFLRNESTEFLKKWLFDVCSYLQEKNDG